LKINCLDPSDSIRRRKMKKTEPLILDNAYFLDSLGSILPSCCDELYSTC
jgi:hypothetical protein